jgi:hypothetical protein
MTDIEAEEVAVPEDYDGGIPTETNNGPRPGDPEIELSQEPGEVYLDANS